MRIGLPQVLLGLLVACTNSGESKNVPTSAERDQEAARPVTPAPDQPEEVSWRDAVRVVIQPRSLRVVLVVDGSEVAGTERVIELPDFSNELALLGMEQDWEGAFDSHLQKLRSQLEEGGRSSSELDVSIDGETSARALNHTIKGTPRSTYHRRLRLDSPERKLTIVEEQPITGEAADCAILFVFLDPAETTVDYLALADARNPPDEEGQGKRPRFGFKRIWEGPPAASQDLVAAAAKAKEMADCVRAVVYWRDDRTWSSVAPVLEALSRELESVALSF